MFSRSVTFGHSSGHSSLPSHGVPELFLGAAAAAGAICCNNSACPSLHFHSPPPSLPPSLTSPERQGNGAGPRREPMRELRNPTPHDWKGRSQRQAREDKTSAGRKRERGQKYVDGVFSVSVSKTEPAVMFQTTVFQCGVESSWRKKSELPQTER